MIDIETEVFSIVSAEVRKKYPKIYMTGEYVKSPPSFPCVSLIDSKMEALGFTRTLMNPVPNEEDATVYRMVARYRAIVSKNKTIYRR